MQKDEYIKGSTFNIIKKYKQNHGLCVLYTGWQFKMIQYVFQAITTVFTLEQFENKSNQIK
jgi:hypothetical protein